MVLRIDKVSKRYGSVWALRDVSFDIGTGKIVGIFGGSGSGKSTVLKAIAGTITTDGGNVYLNSRDISNNKPQDRGINTLSGNDVEHHHGLFRRTSPDGASGDQQIGSFRKMIADHGSLLMFDEPFSQMDRVMRENCFGELRRVLGDLQNPVLFASRDFEQIACVCDEVVFLSRGEIVQTGTPQDIYDEPETVEAATLTGETNLIDARRLTSSDAQLPEYYTIKGGHRIFGQPLEKRRLMPIDQDITLAIRPEQISMSLGASFPEDNLVKGVLTAIKFLGSTSLIEFDASGLKLTTRVFQVVGLNIGDECMLGLPPHWMRILIG
jgi:ABC-type Fe3+/spermidine/putrescine transport system ATPase subunit